MRVAVLVLLLPALALAQDDVSQAKRHYEAGLAAYNDNRYAEAALEFEAARKLHPSPRLDFNIGRCRDRLGQWQAAIDSYEAFIKDDPDDPDLDETRQRIGDLKRYLSPTVLASQPVVTKPAHRLRLPAAIVGGLAVGSLAVGGALLGNALATYHSLDGSCSPNCSRASWASLPGQQAGGEAMLAIGGALVVADVVLWAMDRRGR